MEKTIVTTGKTIDEAIENALTQLGLDRDNVSVQVLSQAKSGFLGIGATPAKVEVTYEAPDPAPKVALSAASRSKPKAPKPQQPKPAPAAEAPKEHKENKEHKAKPVKVEKPAVQKTYAPAAPGSVEEKIEVFLKGLLEHMGSAAVPHAWAEGDNNYMVELTGEDLGYLIGRRGDTLDALQHLANYTVNRGIEYGQKRRCRRAHRPRACQCRLPCRHSCR